MPPLLAFPAAARFNLRVQPDARDTFAGNFFTPARFGGMLALLVFTAFPQVFFGLETFGARDCGFFAIPLAQFQQHCLLHGEIPFWNPYNHGGGPFLAHWNTMSLYPLALVCLLLPLKWALAAFSLLHLWWAGMGMFFLARRWTDNRFAPAVAGMVFAVAGFALDFGVWSGSLAAFSWMPWVILAAEKAWREGWQKILLAAVVGSLQMLTGGLEVILLTWLIAAGWWLGQMFRSAAGSRPAGQTPDHSDGSAGETPAARCLAMLWRFPLVAALVVSLTLPQLLPFFDLVTHSQGEKIFAHQREALLKANGLGLTNFPPRITAGQQPFFLDDTQALAALRQNTFDGSKMVFLPADEKPLVTVSNPSSAKVLDAKFGINWVSIEAEAAERSLIVVAQSWHPNWGVEVDGQPMRLLRANVTSQAVEIPAGTHQIQLFYQDRMFMLGVGISFCMALNCLFACVLMLIRKFTTPAPPEPEDEEDRYF